MTKREIVLLAACAFVIGWIAKEAWAIGGDQCTGKINAAGDLTCTSNGCPGTCANSGWTSACGGVSVWRWNGTSWVHEKILSSADGINVQHCACDGITHTCCRTVKVQDGTGFKYGTYGGCWMDCDPPQGGTCQPGGAPGGDVEAICAVEP